MPECSCDCRCRYPETRLGAILEVEKEWEIAELIFLRIGYEYGWKLVARLAGVMPVAEDRDADQTLDDLEKQVAGFGTMLAGIGHLNKAKSPGIRHALSLLRARKQRPPVEDKGPLDDLERMSLGRSLTETFLELQRPDIEKQTGMSMQPSEEKPGQVGTSGASKQ